MTNIKNQLLSRLNDRQEEMVDFLKRLLRTPTPNPPGDTKAAMALVEAFLTERGIDYEIVAPHADMPNLIAQFTGGAEGPRLAMNGHLDVFPVADPATWTHDPWAAHEEDGRLYGRGACDMKSGTTALLFAFAELHELRQHLKGSVVLSVVSDEETFGPWGARYLVEHRKDILGDCLLNAEPTSPHALRFGEKGRLWLRFTVRTPGAHGAYVHLSRNAASIAAKVISGLQSLEELRSPADTPLARTLEQHAPAINRAYGQGASQIISGTTVNVGVINGGVKINMVPSECVFDVDIRVSPGVPRAQVMGRVESLIAPFPDVSFTILSEDEASTSPPDHPMVEYILQNATEVSGTTPAPIIALGGCDARLWRYAGVPAYVFGPSPTGMGCDNEYVKIDEFLQVAKIHALAAADYLTQL